MTDVPVKLECSCGAKMEFTVQQYETAEKWTESFWKVHAGCLPLTQETTVKFDPKMIHGLDKEKANGRTGTDAP